MLCSNLQEVINLEFNTHSNVFDHMKNKTLVETNQKLCLQSVLQTEMYAIIIYVKRRIHAYYVPNIRRVHVQCDSVSAALIVRFKCALLLRGRVVASSRLF